jgi:Ca-activated chloride channel family protein
LLDLLRLGDRFALISYADQWQVVVEGPGSTDKEACIQAIQGLTAGGGTQGSRALEGAARKVLQQAIPGGSNQLILATDGAFADGTADAVQRAARFRKKGITTSVLCIRCGNYTSREMQKLAEASSGRFVPILQPEQAGLQLIDEIKMATRYP